MKSFVVTLCLLLSTTTSQAFISHIRSQGEKLECVGTAAILGAYARGTINVTVASTRLTTLLQLNSPPGTVFSAQDNTDLTNIKNHIDGLTDANPNVQLARKLNYVNEIFSYCALFERGSDALLSETELRSLLGIP